MRILLSANTSWYLNNFRYGLILELINRGYEVIVVAPPDETTPELEAMGCRFIPIHIESKSKNVFKDANIFLQYLSIFRKEQPAWYVSFTIKSNIYGGMAARRLGVPYLATITGLGTVFILENSVTKLVEIMYKVAFRKANKVFFQNSTDQVLFESRGLVKDTEVRRVPGSGINIDTFQYEPIRQKKVSEPFVFLMMARLLWDKGIMEFVEAAKEIRKVNNNVECRLLGPIVRDNPTAISEDELKESVTTGGVTYLGSTRNVKEHLLDADCVVLPSYREGLARVLLEASATGRPVIATRVPGCQDVVDDGITGLLCRPRDSQDLVEKMQMMLSFSVNERQRMGRCGRQRIEREFDERIVVGHYLQVILNT